MDHPLVEMSLAFLSEDVQALGRTNGQSGCSSIQRKHANPFVMWDNEAGPEFSAPSYQKERMAHFSASPPSKAVALLKLTVKP